MEAPSNHETSVHGVPEVPSQRSRIVAITGPTATGKTALGVALALRFGGEVVNADSRYLYRGFDIGVAKPSLQERQGVPHHLIDILPPYGMMSLASYQDLAMIALRDILARGRPPVLAGGTPLYINAVVEGWRIPRVPPNYDLRAALETEAAESGIAALAERLRVIDPATAARSGNNARRIIRALEIHDATGIPMSELEGKGPPPFDTLEIGLTAPRRWLYQRVDDRVLAHIDRGLVAEVQTLLASGISETAPAMKSLGYRQLLPYLRGECSLDQAVARTQLDTHRYIRHQETWFRRNPRLVWFDVTTPGWQEAVMTHIGDFLNPPDASIERE
ncbi:MAG: tRNA (adenosine(37)-N6)-dimethylallyltransferase MiaA [Chloroflexia bacterium]|nr:tRNA (adenosine(37)-N6)-dimethylallyltransferase MiaA [Chloroflexia bacterium]